MGLFSHASEEESLLALCALGVDAKRRPEIEEMGSARAFLLEHYDNDKLESAQKNIRMLDFFKTSGGQILFNGKLSKIGRLARSAVPPLATFFRGNADVLASSPALAIVGSRNASPRGLARAYDIAKACAKSGILVVSGGALGIDMAAHEGAIDGKGETIAVLGDTVKANKDERPGRLKRWQHLQTFHSVTTYGPWVPQSGSLFAVRNQYVAALADAVLFVEGTSYSGALHTARYAKLLDIPTWAIPGDPDAVLAQGPNQLIAQGEARIMLSENALLETLIETPKGKKGKVKNQKQNKQLPPLLQVIQEHGGEMDFESLRAESGLDSSQIELTLFDLELQGRLARQGSKYLLIRH